MQPEQVLDREDVITMMGALFDIRSCVTDLTTYSSRTMKGKKRKSRRTPEQRTESERIGRKLEERIAYHKAKLAEERRGGSEGA